jgi:hypothetical protein
LFRTPRFAKRVRAHTAECRPYSMCLRADVDMWREWLSRGYAAEPQENLAVRKEPALHVSRVFQYQRFWKP